MIFRILFLFVLGCGDVLSLSAQVDKEMLWFLQNNKLPDNLKVSLRYEEFEKEQWKLRSRMILLWDFKRQRARAEELSCTDDETKSIALKKIVVMNGKSISSIEFFSENSETLSSKTILASDKGYEDVKKLKRGRIASVVTMFDFGQLDRFYMNYFFAWDGLLFTQAIERGVQSGISMTLKPLKDATELTLAKKDRPAIIYSFDTLTGVVKSRSVLKKDLSGTISKDRHCEVIKTKRIGDYNIPTEMDVIFNRYIAGSQIISECVKSRIIVEDKSILVNQELMDRDFKLKIPVGAEVDDYTKDMIYVSDGVTGDPEIHEHLTDSLEEVLCEAEKQRK